MGEVEFIEPRVVPRPQHPISRSLIDRNALKVLYRLHEAGFRALLVGGSVRDLMLGRQPKDFDVATDARPNEIRRLFRNARIIGRRFRLAHVLFKEGVIEVSTFRREPEPSEQAGGPDDLLITSDNAFGTPHQDAFRRDFTVNALFYDIADYSVLDYTGGLDDLEARLIRAIGDPDVRFREDPVRMMRACELAGRLGFGMERGTQEALHRQRGEITRAASARLAEELVQLLQCGRAGEALQWALDLGLLEVQLPEVYAMLTAGRRGLGDLGRILPVVDRMVASGRGFKDTVLLAALLLPSFLLQRYDRETAARRLLSRDELAPLVAAVSEGFLERFALPKAKGHELRETLLSFADLCVVPRREGARRRAAAHPFFRQGLELFELLVEATGEGREELALWQAEAARQPRLQLVTTAAVDAAAEGEKAASRRRRSKRRRRRGTRAVAVGGEGQGS